MFELIDLSLLDTILRSISIFCLRKNLMSKSLRIALYYYQRITVEPEDIPIHKFLLTDHHIKVQDISWRRMLSRYGQNIQLDSISHIIAYLQGIKNWWDTFKHMNEFNYPHNMEQNRQQHIIELHLKNTSMADQDILKHIFLWLDLTMYRLNILSHKTQLNHLHIRSNHICSLSHIFLSYFVYIEEIMDTF